MPEGPNKGSEGTRPRLKKRRVGRTRINPTRRRAAVGGVRGRNSMNPKEMILNPKYEEVTGRSKSNKLSTKKSVKNPK